MVASALGVFIQSEAEVEAQVDQIGNLTGFGVGREGGCGNNGMHDAKWYGLFLFDRRVLKAVGFKLLGKTSAQSGMGLGVERFSWVGKAIQ